MYYGIKAVQHKYLLTDTTMAVDLHGSLNIQTRLLFCWLI